MRALDHFPEPFPPTGTMAAEGVLNQLGRPRMGHLEVLVREAVQNCWDARSDGSPQVKVGFALGDLDPSQRRAVSEVLFASLPPEPTAQPVRECRRVLVISDRGTRGLGGPLRADTDGEGDPKDFVDFLRNLGQPPDTSRGGGTYGFGKVALYLASAHRTLVVHTRCSYEGKLQSRFMAARLGHQFTEGGRRYTGRHWWARRAPDGVLDPALDHEADGLASLLGLPAFGEEERGTTIAILDPYLGDFSDQEAMQSIAQAIVWNFWPKMIEHGGKPAPMTFAVSRGGSPLALPDLRTDPVLSAFRVAYLNLKESLVSGRYLNDDGATTTDIDCGKPRQRLGLLSLTKFPHVLERKQETESGSDEDSVYRGLGAGRVHHTALLRFPELVVTYLAGPESASPNVGYAGVFLADGDLDRIFARSEPPTHDEWVPEGLAVRSHKIFVRVALRRVVDAMKAFAGVAGQDPESVSGSSLAGLAERLSGLLPGVSGPGAGVSDPPLSREATRKGGGRPPTPRVEILGEPTLELLDGEPALLVQGCLRVPEGHPSVSVRAHAGVVLVAGRRETEAPEGSDSPRVLRWINEAEEEIGTSDVMRFQGHGDHFFSLLVSLPQDAVISIDLELVD